MNNSILWNGFEIKKGVIETSSGSVPFLLYTPEISTQPLNIAIHGETDSKEEWLCFTSISKFGNLLKESIKMNSPFLAFDLYGHGEWKSEDKGFDPGQMTPEQEKYFIDKSISGISEAISKIVISENLIKNPISVTGFSKGCNVAINITLTVNKLLLVSPFKHSSSTSCTDILIFRGERDNFVSKEDFNQFADEILPQASIKRYDSTHEIPEDWINRGKNFIYT